MRKNTGFMVRKAQDAYVVSRCGEAGATLLYAERPYGDAKRLCAMHGEEMWIETPDPARRIYFCLREDSGKTYWAADTAVELPMVENFRDQGGYRTQAGRTVKWGRFFRSGALRGMEGEALSLYQALGIATILDYRAVEESGEAPDVVPEGAVHKLVPAIPVPETDQELEDMDMKKQLQRVHSEADAKKMMDVFLSLYDNLAFDNAAYRAMFEALDAEETVPLVQHCSAGKDRTGVGCMLLLLALGVDVETAKADYLLSSIFRKQANAQFIAQFSGMGLSEHAVRVMAQIMDVTDAMIGRTLSAIHAKYPSIEAFLADEYDVTPARRARWVQMHTVE